MKQRGFLALGPINAMLGMVPAFAWALIVAGLMATVLVERTRRQNADAKLHVKTAEMATYKSEVETRETQRHLLALQAVEEKMELGRFRNKHASETDNAYRTELKKRDVALAEYRDRQRLLDDTIDILTAASRDRGQGGGDPVALKRAERISATLGLLLKTCSREAAEDAAELERLAGQVRGLQLRYSTLLSRPSTASEVAPASAGRPPASAAQPAN